MSHVRRSALAWWPPLFGLMVMVAIVAFDIPNVQASSAQNAPSFAIMAPTRDKAKSDEAIARLRKSSEAKGTTYNEEKYKDATIVVGDAPRRVVGAGGGRTHVDEDQRA